MRYAIADFREKDGQIIDTNLIWCEGSQKVYLNKTDAEEAINGNK